MNRIIDKNSLLAWLEQYAPYMMIQRALKDPNAKHENLGYFKVVPPTSLPGWIVKVTSTHDKTWVVVIQGVPFTNTYRTWVMLDGNIEWKYWIGNTCVNPLWVGDHPGDYKELKENVKR